jgi:hypothetical protein
VDPCGGGDRMKGHTLKIIPVENGFVVSDESRVINGATDKWIFTDGLSLAAWINDYYIDADKEDKE